jgi:hypothetical protein
MKQSVRKAELRATKPHQVLPVPSLPVRRDRSTVSFTSIVEDEHALNINELVKLVLLRPGCIMPEQYTVHLTLLLLPDYTRRHIGLNHMIV